MRFLADESCDFAIVRALRAAGHEVTSVRDVARSADDERVSQLAIEEDRVLLTEDKDFGQIVYAAATRCPGVILVRFPGNARQGAVAAVLELLEKVGDGIGGRFVVVQPGRVRISERLGNTT